MTLADFIPSYILFVAQIISVLVSVFLIVNLLHKAASRTEKIVLGVLYTYALPILIMTVLGTFKILFYPYFWAGLILANVILGILWQLKKRKNRTADMQVQDFKKPTGLSEIKKDWKVYLIYLPLIAFLVLKFLNALLWQSFETDSVVYHLPFAVKWFQTGNIWPPYYTSYSGPLGYYPGNFELLYLFNFFPFGRDFLMNLLSFPLLPAFGMVIYLMAIALKLPKEKAIFASAIFMMPPMILRQTGITQNDLFYIFTFAVAIYYALKIYLEKKVSWREVVPLGVSLGLFIGTKSAGIVYGGIFLIIFAAIIWRIFKKNEHLNFWKFSGGVAGLSFLFGGFWYVRNLIYAANPLFPMDLKIGGWHILEGYGPLAEFYAGSRLLANPNMISFTEFFKSGLFSFGPMFFILFTVVFSAFFVYLFKKAEERKMVLWLSAFAILAFFIYLITPFTSSHIYPNIRYMLPFLVIAYLILLIIQKRGWKLFYLLSLSTFGLIYFQGRLLRYLNDYVSYDFKWTLGSHPGLFLGVGFSFLLVVAAIFYFKNWGKRLILLGIFAVLLGFIFYRSFEIRDERGADAYIAFTNLGYHRTMFEAFQFVNANLPKDAKIAFTMGASHYMLYGPEWTRDVDYININDCQDCDYFEFRRAKDSILENPDYNSWERNLKIAGKEYLVILFKYFPDERKVPQYELNWALQHPDKFEKIFNDGETWVFMIR